MRTQDDWNRWSALVLSELKRLAESNEKHASALGEIKTQLAELRVQAGLAGAVAGFLVSLVPVVAGFMLDHWLKK